MPRTLSPIPTGMLIVDDNGAITLFFRLAWQTLIDSFTTSPTAATVQKLSQTAALPTAAAFTTRATGLYRVSWYLRKTVADGVSSSLTLTLGWTESGLAVTEAEAALTTDTITAQQSGSKVVWADGATDLTYQVAYASNTPAKMNYRLDVSVESLAS